MLVIISSYSNSRAKSALRTFFPPYRYVPVIIGNVTENPQKASCPLHAQGYKCYQLTFCTYRDPYLNRDEHLNIIDSWGGGPHSLPGFFHFSGHQVLSLLS